MPQENIVVRGAREHNLKNVQRNDPPQQAGRHYRRVGLRQELPRLRHRVCRGPAPLRRVAVGVRQAVPGPHGQARRGLYRGPVTGHLHRPEGGYPATPGPLSVPSPRSTTTSGSSSPGWAGPTATTVGAPSRGRPSSRSWTLSCPSPTGAASRSWLPW